MRLLWILSVAVLAAPIVDSAKILVIAPFLGRSHSIYINSIVSELGRRGHDITMITTNVIKDPPPNIKQIILGPNPAFGKALTVMDMFGLDALPGIMQTWFVWNLMFDGTVGYIEMDAIQKFIAEDKSSFDLVICELFFQDVFYAFAHKYNAPLVLLGTSSYWNTINEGMGNPPTLSWLSHEFSREFGDLTLYQRLANYAMGTFHRYIYKLYMIPKQNELIRKHFKNSPQPLPTVSELEKNVSVVLFNTHFTFDAARPLVPGIVEVGGVHLKPANKLPEDLQKWLDGAKDGVIYMSLGSNLRSSALPKDKVDVFLKVFSKLKQRVLWKWETDNPPFKLDNVMTSTWLPQSDVLAHPNIKAFITQTGMLSIQEAIHRGVPLIGIPVYGDQHLNMAKLEHHGLGIRLGFAELSEETLSKTINSILYDPKYAKNAKDVSDRFHDQLNTPLETAAFWIEYVIRHKGAKFMKSRLIDTPWYQYYFLDVYAILLFILFINILILKCVIKFLLNLCRKKEVKKTKTGSKKHN